LRALRKDANWTEFALSSSGEREPIAVLVMEPTVALESQKTNRGNCGLRLLQSLSKVFHHIVLVLLDILDVEAQQALASHWGAWKLRKYTRRGPYWTLNKRIRGEEWIRVTDSTVVEWPQSLKDKEKQISRPYWPWQSALDEQIKYPCAV
jgi:hypothetical protein